ncbi:flagellar motor stator protein MotA [Parendozoicomonas haliclonae]|uniref:Chemotaxis protein LafT n=1 Tax=Parendozoicomonas haliclonae TaxID=1960125 RepID=A0A1X7AGE3_9GAMM|nr:flagellar motor stator protein MotA [Parendozoicomonas haliclonae]SMA39814.1 Chemotaxis protein LafT [Parendozoicomonas haliclonae]
MFKVAGFIILLASILGGFVLAHGNLINLWQPYEILIIAGGAFGAFCIAHPWKVVAAAGRHIKFTLTGTGYNQKYYETLLQMLNQLFEVARKQGGRKQLEEHIENPDNSELFKSYPRILKTPQTMLFITDNFRLSLVDNLDTHNFEALMEHEIETYEGELSRPGKALQEIADALPGFGIMAAVLGIVITMQSLDGPPEQLGAHIGAALVGTFMGVFLGYGVVGPMAGSIVHSVHYEIKALECIKASLISFRHGTPPAMAVEAGRKVLFSESRPSFEEMEKILEG